MLRTAWDEIEYIYTLPGLDPKTIDQFKTLKTSQSSHARAEGNTHHYCSFFLPYDRNEGKIYLGHHIKADDWIPPGGHIESGETPKDAAIREMMEELKTTITKDQLIPFNLSVKVANQPERGCIAHYDVWHLVNIKVREFDYLKSEYYDAGWFAVSDGANKITKNPDFAEIVMKIGREYLAPTKKTM